MNNLARSLLPFLTIVATAATAAPAITVTETDQQIRLTAGPLPVLTYHKASVPPPPGIDPVFTRSGFIHPLHAPAGGTVTGIHPADHYHHLGLWHAWVQTRHDGKPMDCWNLKDKTGRVRFVKTLATRQQDDAATFVVEQEQLQYRDGKGGDPVVVLREQLTVTARLVAGAYEIDYDIQQANISQHPLTLPAYRYGGGIAYRAPHSWNATNSNYRTSEGKTRKDSHTTRARWIAMHGPTDSGPATVTVLCHPKNHDAPQRLRTWDDGKVFLNYVPTQESAWEIKPGQTITLRYRIIVSDGQPDAKTLDARWQRYAQ